MKNAQSVFTEIQRNAITIIVVVLTLVPSISISAEIKPLYESAFNNLIPKPVEARIKKGSFEINSETRIYYFPINEQMKKLSEQLAKILRPATGFTLKVVPFSEEKKENSICLIETATDTLHGIEFYTLDININSIELKAMAGAGIFRGIQTLRQLLPSAIEMQTPQPIKWQIACCTIQDYPRFAWRGAMLDVARHFFSVEDVKRYIDLLAIYKINVFHIHLTDDQGWRIEIKSWPKLTEIGGSTEIGDGEGGFYTQEEFKEIVAYAADRYIEIIPEIDLPGHITAAQASYAFLTCDSIAPNPYTGKSVGFSSICITKETTYSFINDVIGELAQMSPSIYIHIGGDEAYKTDSVEYVYFINRVEAIVRQNHKIMIGWDEIANANLSNSTIVQHWWNKFYKMTSQSQAQLIISPANLCYIDMKYTKASRIGQTWAGLIEIEKGYNWEVDTILKDIDHSRIIGIEAPLWTEMVENMQDIEYLAFPRIPGYAEIGWSSKNNRNWIEYRKRLANHAPRFNALNINFYRSPQVEWHD